MAGQYLNLTSSSIHGPALAAKAKETEPHIYLLSHCLTLTFGEAKIIKSHCNKNL
jgi:hypothetical protein